MYEELDLHIKVLDEKDVQKLYEEAEAKSDTDLWFEQQLELEEVWNS